MVHIVGLKARQLHCILVGGLGIPLVAVKPAAKATDAGVLSKLRRELGPRAGALEDPVRKIMASPSGAA